MDNLDYEGFNRLNDAYFDVNIEQILDSWYAVDGKELRGNIDEVSGEMRGENIVKSVSHEDFSSQVIGFYHGAKDSEKTIVQDYFSTKESIESAYSFDALHTWMKGGKILVFRHLSQYIDNEPELKMVCSVKKWRVW